MVSMTLERKVLVGFLGGFFGSTTHAFPYITGFMPNGLFFLIRKVGIKTSPNWECLTKGLREGSEKGFKQLLWRSL